ncbi:MAG: hypothetical protein ABI670_04990 [Chloroflexota bacterium]
MNIKTMIANRRQTFSLNGLLAHLRMPLYRNAYALMLTVVTTSGLGIVYWVLAARYYPIEVVGVNSAIVSAMTFVAGLSQRSLISALVRFIPQAGRSTRKLILLAYLASVVGTAIIGPIFLFGLSIWSPQLRVIGTDPVLATWFILSAMVWCLFTLQDSALTGLREAVWVPLENTIYAIAKLGLLVLFAASFPLYGIFASWTIPVAFTLLPMNYLIFRRLIPKHIKATSIQAAPIRVGQLTRYMAGDYLGGLFSLSSTTLLPVLVATKAGAAANAYFYLAWLVATSLQLVTTNMVMSLTVEAAADETKLLDYTYRTFVHIARLLLPLVIVMLIAAPLVLWVFGSNYADEGATLLRLLTLATVPQMINAIYMGMARVQKRMANIVYVQMALCIGILGVSYFLLGSYGITAVGWAVLISQTIVATVLIFGPMRPVLAHIRQRYIPRRTHVDPTEDAYLIKQDSAGGTPE